jgi:WD40 repeat protein
MRTVLVGRTLVSRLNSRWCALSSRRRAALALAVLAASLVSPWLAFRWWTRWPIEAILRNGDTWPLAFSPDGRTFATSAHGRVTLWDVDTGRARATWGVDASRSIMSGAFSPDGRVFAAALANHPQAIEIALVDASTGRVTARVPTGHTGLYDLAFTDDGRTLRGFLGDWPDLKEVVRWDMATGNETSRRPLTCRIGGCDTAISPDGHLMAVVPYDRKVKEVKIWDLDADREFAVLSDPSSPGNFGRGLGISADNRTLAVGRDDGAIEVWDLPARRLRTILWGHTADYWSCGIRFAPDGRTLASRGEYLRPSSLRSNLNLSFRRAFQGRSWSPAPEVVVWDIKSGGRLARAAEAVHPFYSPDSAMIATSETDYSVRLRTAPSPVR